MTALGYIAGLRPSIDAFFDKVMVMAPEEELRRSRIALLAQILGEFSRIGDLAELAAG